MSNTARARAKNSLKLKKLCKLSSFFNPNESMQRK